MRPLDLRLDAVSDTAPASAIADTVRRQVAQALRTEAPAFARIARSFLPAALRPFLGAAVEKAAQRLVYAIANYIDPSTPDPLPA